MSLDELARSAAADLWADTERTLDVETGLSALHHARNRRRVGWAVAAVAATVIALLVLTTPWPRRQALPATPPRPTTVETLVFQDGMAGLTALGGSLPTLTAKVKANAAASMSFAPDGSALAYSAGDVVHVVDIATGGDRKLGPCRQASCPVAWSPDSSSVVTAAPHALVLIPVGVGTASTVPLPSNWSITGLDVNMAGQVAMTGTAGTSQAVMTVDLDSGHSELVCTFDLHVDVGDPRWLPGGRSFLYLQWRGLQDGHSNDLSVREIRADGKDVRVVAQLGHCECYTPVRPSMDVSPQGRVVVSAVGRDRASVVEVGADRRLTTLFSAPINDSVRWIGTVAWRSVPAPP
ncbi:hypothetical protein [Knoellia koreensis]|uniref:Uncharacterized protein n=1 Tax=Knoellia koreensis TaxID=2730921 RepID=A0A849HFY0_9MICO|nr:hypothetical protein [Knoellia sp. DB2414S]NNM45514.1 hypothetical protein [Knoellia sp. DB2414S]